jgi:hypothetical protein
MEQLMTAFGTNTIRDLSKLSLIFSPRRGYWKLKEPIENPELALAVAISNIPSFQVVVSELQKNFDASGRELGQTIAEYLGREWNTASCQRNGAAYKRWVVNLYPNFKLPKKGDRSFLRARSAATNTGKKGRTSYMTPDVLLFIGEQKRLGKNVVQISKELSLTPTTIYNWRRANPEKWGKL